MAAIPASGKRNAADSRRREATVVAPPAGRRKSHSQPREAAQPPIPRARKGVRWRGGGRAAVEPARTLNLIADMVDGELRVADAMQREVVTMAPEERLDLASDLMTLGRIRHIPVVTGGEVVGMLTQRDLFRAAISSVLELRPAAEREWLGKIHVNEVMTQPVVTGRAEWSLRRAVDLMIERRIGGLPVVENGQLVGLLSESDCLRLLAQLLGSAAGGARATA
jgi:acetoin utilization protein AcuB